MEKTIRVLTVLLVVQVALAVGLQFTGNELTAAPKAGPLVQFKPDTIDRIAIAASPDQEIELKRGDAGWTLPGADGFPADPDKVERLLTRIRDLRAGEVVARTSSARERFQVAPEAFKRRITLSTGEKKRARLYFGTSPDKDRIHVRREGDNPIQIVGFGTYDAPVELADWRDKTLVQISADAVAGIEIGDLRIERVQANADEQGQAGSWKAVATPSGHKVQHEAMATLTQRLAGLRIAGVLGEEEPEGYEWGSPVLDLKVERKEGEPVRLRIARKRGEKDKKEYALKASSRAEYFRLATPVAEQLIEAASRDQLLGKKTSKENKDADGSGDTG